MLIYSVISAFRENSAVGWEKCRKNFTVLDGYYMMANLVLSERADRDNVNVNG